MKITYLGTAAAEGMPAVWCNCAACKRAKQSGGKNIRTRSQVLVNNDMLVDFPMDTYMHMLNCGFDLSAISTVLITHAHMDHCYPQEFMLHGAPYAHNMTNPTINVYGNKTVIDTILIHNQKEGRTDIAESVKLNIIKPYDEIITGDYKITALPAQHTKGEECLIYLISAKGKTALMFNDSGILDIEVYKKIAALNIKLDFISFDCTYGFARHGEGRHMGALDNFDELEKMKTAGILKPNTYRYLTHFSHNGNLLHDELRLKCEPLGFGVAYDGFTLDV